MEIYFINYKRRFKIVLKDIYNIRKSKVSDRTASKYEFLEISTHFQKN